MRLFAFGKYSSRSVIFVTLVIIHHQAHGAVSPSRIFTTFSGSASFVSVLWGKHHHTIVHIAYSSLMQNARNAMRSYTTRRDVLCALGWCAMMMSSQPPATYSSSSSSTIRQPLLQPLAKVSRARRKTYSFAPAHLYFALAWLGFCYIRGLCCMAWAQCCLRIGLSLSFYVYFNGE